MTTRRTWLAAAVLVAGTVTGSAAMLAVGPQTHDHGATAAPSSAVTPAPEQAPPHDRMMAEMRARDARLESLVKTMDGATGDAKIDVMAGILRELVQNEKAMHDAMTGMHAPATGGEPGVRYIH
jgi:hypothetical protein